MRKAPIAAALVVTALSMFACGGAGDPSEKASGASSALDDLQPIAPAADEGKVITSLDGSKSEAELDRAVMDWIQSSLDMSYVRKSGEIHAADFHRDVRYTRHFSDALLGEITFPGGDGTSKDSGYLNLTWTPDQIWNELPDGGAGKTETNPSDMKAKQLALSSNVRLTLDGVPTRTISKVSRLTITQTPRADGAGDTRDLDLVFASTERAAWDAWQRSWIATKGQDTRSGTLTYTDPVRGDDLITLTLHDVGIFSLSDEPKRNDDDKIKRVKATIRAGSMAIRCFKNCN